MTMMMIARPQLIGGVSAASARQLRCYRSLHGLTVNAPRTRSVASFSSLRRPSLKLMKCQYGLLPRRSPPQTTTLTTSFYGTTSRRLFSSEQQIATKVKTKPPEQIAGRGGGGSSKTHKKGTFRARVIKYVRIPALVATVYGLGFQMGVMEFSSNPEEKEKEIMDSVVKSVGCQDPSKGVRMYTDGDWKKLSKMVALAEDDQMRRVVNVGETIVNTGKLMLQQDKDELQSELTKKLNLPDDTIKDETKLQDALGQEKDYVEATKSLQMMEGQWSYVLIDSDIPNAFVTQTLPRKVFVTTAMMNKFIDNDDEMAMVVGHEVSHLILGHVGRLNILEAVLSTLQVVCLTACDAAGGEVSVKVMMAIETCKRWAGNAYSRDNERAADDMGIKLAAMSCFDTRRGAEVFRKMYAAEPAGQSLTISFEKTHPNTEERYEHLVQESKEENASKYKHTTCAKVSTKFKDAIQKAKKSSSSRWGG